jgi:uncharacterized RDD family membrane protein YckC
MDATAPDPGALAPAAEALIGHPDLARLTSAVQAPQAAIRARVNAIVLDLILLGLLSTVLAALLHSSSSASTRAVIFLVLEFAYFFVFELRGGQTIGKRRFHVRVTTVDGRPPSARQIAVRNVLRLVDALPFLYASGLISLIRTGPARRQRIGDVAAATTVVLEPGGRELPTPRWLLPALTLLATLLSLAIIIPVLSGARREAGSVREPVLGGFGAQQLPAEGEWSAHAQLLAHSGPAVPTSASATWTIWRSCDESGRCGMHLAALAGHEAPRSAELLVAPGEWIATFAPREARCGQRGGHPLFWQLHVTLVMHLDASGRQGEGEERSYAQSQGCGFGSATQRWTAALNG